MELDGSRAEVEDASYLLAGEAVDNFSQDQTLSRGQIHRPWRHGLGEDVRGHARCGGCRIGEGHGAITFA